MPFVLFFFFFQAEDGIRDGTVTWSSDVCSSDLFLSRTGSLECPDQLVVDFDPPDADHFGDACEAALLLRDLLESDLGLTTFVKTTGGKGLHVHVPLDGRGDFDEVRAFSRSAVSLLADGHPDLVTTEQRRDKRGGRVYADIMRNAYAQTVVAPYSVRARPGAPVAVPPHWSEVRDRDLSPGSFTLHTVPAGWSGSAARTTPG